MMRSLWTAASGMVGQQFTIDTIANNLANVNTGGFKKSRVDFQDLLYQTLRFAGTPVTAGAEIPTGLQVGHGVRPVATVKIFTQGTFRETDNPLDLVIEGDGFFQILMPDGTVAYTRDGAFKKDSEGRLVTSDGFALEPEIVIPPEAMEVSVASDGTVSVINPGSNEPQTVGQLELARFVNPAGLRNYGRNLFLATAASGQPIVGQPGLDGFGSLAQGFLEISNVQVVEEMVNLILAQRAYDANSKAIQASDDMLNTANNLRR
ncbi:MAG: flagellar basal-body rod protein FlgG [Limnochordaceae bacterium]|uniref:Flagellar basal-body rod protein FlgG n=1 Tax=Carboxydichorda subterranea TaxID=3109565 RepID=A0ABZ1BWC6_9FIRM|nr:flagellar basal-body rod protein FlgG [Limnochorda sp. L945t]MBE3599444.1 flagellar basal-body rod protein FlgG [Limnochordaceae bacterium]WRP16920.1 flagellar basal-body rod protein FlgG [Limnochorda sp. L945t]